MNNPQIQNIAISCDEGEDGRQVYQAHVFMADRRVIKGFQQFDTVVSNLPDSLNKTVRKRSKTEDYNCKAITDYATEYIKFSLKTYTLLP